MKIIKNVAAMLAASLLVVGCANVEKKSWQECAIAGAVIGGAAGGFGDDHDSEDAVLSAIGGAVIGGTICVLMGDDVKAAEALKDLDNDGVADYKDQCLHSAAGADVNELGCVASLVLEGVNFHTNSAVLTDSAKAILAPIAMAHHQHHADVNLLISGHTDSQGSSAYNKALSQQRAEAVVAYMVGHGCDAAKLTAVGFGEDKAMADNATAEGRAQNRRVELSIK